LKLKPAFRLVLNLKLLLASNRKINDEEYVTAVIENTFHLSAKPTDRSHRTITDQYKKKYQENSQHLPTEQ
jgi:hypothetical protein